MASDAGPAIRLGAADIAHRQDCLCY